MVRQSRSGFTVVELLIGISIVLTLGAILLPAIGASREAARMNGCRNNVAQLSKAMIHHESMQGFFPSGGWSPKWLGVAARSGDQAQPGGWTFGVLPYVEELSTRNIVANVAAGGENAAYQKLVSMPLPVFSCPSRRSSQALPMASTTFHNVTMPLTKATRSDFVVNGGSGGSPLLNTGFQGLCPRLSTFTAAAAETAKSASGKAKKVDICHAPPGNPKNGQSLSVAVSALNGHQNHPGDTLGKCDTCDQPVDAILSDPATLAEGDSWVKMTQSQRFANLADMGIPDVINDGLSGRMSRPKAASVFDGLSNTYLVAEKYVAANTYFAGTDAGDKGSMLAGFSSDTVRYAIVPPARDQKGVSNPRAFGSSHVGGWNVAYADGMVRTVTFDIDPTLHAQLASRNDGKGMPPK